MWLIVHEKIEHIKTIAPKAENIEKLQNHSVYEIFIYCTIYCINC